MIFFSDNERVSLLISLMMSPDYDFTIERAADELDISRALIRSDLATIIGTLGSIYSGENESEDFITDIKNGLYDKEPISIESGQMFMDSYLLCASVHEYPYIREWLDKKDAIYHVKGNNCTKNMKKTFPILEDAVALSYSVEFDYRDYDGIEKKCKCSPIMLRISSADIEDSKCFSRNGRVFNISGMSNIHKINGYDEDVAAAVPDWDLLWGTNWQMGEPDFHVRLEVNPNTRNLLNKFKADIANRKSGSLTQNDDKYIYEDDVTGKEDFKEWLRRYGSSIKVLEPEWLAGEIVEDSQKIRRQYESGCFE